MSLKEKFTNKKKKLSAIFNAHATSENKLIALTMGLAIAGGATFAAAPLVSAFLLTGAAGGVLGLIGNAIADGLKEKKTPKAGKKNPGL